MVDDANLLRVDNADNAEEVDIDARASAIVLPSNDNAEEVDIDARASAIVLPSNDREGAELIEAATNLLRSAPMLIEDTEEIAHMP